jgi:hypothetical protein
MASAPLPSRVHAIRVKHLFEGGSNHKLGHAMPPLLELSAGAPAGARGRFIQDVQRTSFHFVVDAADVLAVYAEADELHPARKTAVVAWPSKAHAAMRRMMTTDARRALTNPK